ncbi:uncharacterized protein LOC127837554 isoform X2 [Dreissena polymorpha]|uniref:uncharacterized protein LOC127837554 isoform X2 n=1 Tax=Dreissena polymorpha TaxID=45954 RepID=UPI002264FDB7|nr:uncharacterized protein LOC127837554 isoform X2 [Dreissena polymorpha]
MFRERKTKSLKHRLGKPVLNVIGRIYTAPEMEQFHKSVLKKNHITLVSDIDLTLSSVLDSLREDGLISSNEEDAIMAEKTKRNQNSKLLYILKKRDPTTGPYDNFKNALKKDYGFLVEKLETTEKQVSSSAAELHRSEKCTHCELMKRIIPSDVTHLLYENGVLTDDELEELNNDAIPRLSRVNRLFDLLRSKNNAEEVATHLESSLRVKYKSLIHDDEGANMSKYVKCRCTRSTTPIEKDEQNNKESCSGTSQIINDLNKDYNSNIIKSISSLENNIPALGHGNELLSLDSNEFQSSLDRPCGATPQEHDENSLNSNQHNKPTRPRWITPNVVSYCQKRRNECLINNTPNLETRVMYNTFDNCLNKYDGSHKNICIDEYVQHSIYLPSSAFVGHYTLPHMQTCYDNRDSEITRPHANTRRRDEKRKCVRKRYRAHVNARSDATKGYDDVDGNPEEDDKSQTPGLGALIETRPKDHDSDLMLVKSVKRALPNNRKLMRKCSRLWDQLFFLREKGDWTTHSLITKKAFEKFSDSPDLKVMLYRSEMCISTFYKSDHAKALEMFDKALECLPMTEMPNWHLTRILPLKVELCTRANKMDEASSLLDDAKQAMVALRPCLSTGAVYFFEAMYLSNILQCTRRDTKSADGISQKVKTCFLTAIEHYDQEEVFSVKSFLNQVYLFLALFSLGVDCKKIRYMHIHEDVKPEDIHLAEHYLSLFENNCWRDSTIWSRMLFYIGRGEQHKQITLNGVWTISNRRIYVQKMAALLSILNS